MVLEAHVTYKSRLLKKLNISIKTGYADLKNQLQAMLVKNPIIKKLEIREPKKKQIVF